MIEFFHSAWQAGLRSRSVQGILLLGVLLVVIAYFSASFSPRQPKTVALDVGFSGVRLSLVLLVLFWVQELVAREIERKTVLFALTYPVPRAYYLIGRFAGVLALAALAALLLGLQLWVVVFAAGGDYDQGFAVAPGLPYWTTLAGLWLDAAVVGAFALWIATLATVPMLPLALGLAFAVAGKALGAVIQYMMAGADGDPDILKLAPIIDAIQWFLPDLSRLDWRVWPMYGVAPGSDAALGGVAMAIAYIGIALSLAAFAFSRREVS